MNLCDFSGWVGWLVRRKLGKRGSPPLASALKYLNMGQSFSGVISMSSFLTSWVAWSKLMCPRRLKVLNIFVIHLENIQLVIMQTMSACKLSDRCQSILFHFHFVSLRVDCLYELFQRANPQLARDRVLQHQEEKFNFESWIFSSL